MQTSPILNDQHAWGGRRFQPSPTGPHATTHEHDESTVIARGRQETQDHPLSQAAVIASSSDNLFNSNPAGPSSLPFTLQNVPSNPRYRAYNLEDTFRRPLPYKSPFTSYNNPTFAVPPHPPHTSYKNVSPLPIHVPLGSPPPAPPRIRSLHHHSQPAYNHYQPAYNHSQPAYNHSQPAYNHSQPAYNHSQPAYFPSVPPVYQNHPSYNVPVTVPVSSPSPVLSSASKTLPTVTHIPILTSKSDFFAWEEGVNSLIRANNLLGHILDPSAYVDPTRPDLAPTPPPILTTSSSVRDIEVSNRWWADDNIAQHILVSRLGSIPRGLLPASNIVTRTALSIYKLLLQYYGTCNFADCAELLSSLHNSTCTTGRVQEFVSKWRTGLSKLQSAHFVFNIKICVSYFVRGLPSIPAFNTLRADLPRRISAIVDDQDYGSFISLTEDVLQLDTIFRPTVQSQTIRAPRAFPTIPATAAPVVPITDTSRLPKKEQTCNNCKSRGLRCVGHTDGTCFQPGGGMEGRRNEYFHNKGRVQAMFAEYLENSFLSHESPLPPDLPATSDSPTLSPSLDSELLLPPIANLSVASFVPNTDFRSDLYTRNDFKLPHLAMASIDFDSAALLSLTATYNALLDSGCTHHIIRDRTLFHNYIARNVSVGTANCGSLEALGTGDVEFRHPFGDRHVIFTLRGCLYAPSAPINLLSVGAITERGMSCLFSPGGITKVSYPKSHPTLPDFSFSATVVNRLSFLHLNFLSPQLPLVPTAMPARFIPSTPAYSFPRVKLDSMLWHRRFGHIGLEATKAALTKDYVKGIQFEGPFISDHCIPCLVGKSPQRSYTFQGNRATKLGELLHMDLCGPFPVQAPHGEKYFFNILDDKSNWGFTYGLRLKSDAFSYFLKTEAFLERSSAATVLSVRCGGELELTAGKMGAHLASKGITLQRTVPYAHQQNGKSERYIRTLEEGGQALLADSGLPMSFWLDAILTRQYLLNRLPTSTLPSNITAFELLMPGKKPDLSHLRVWGCDCYVAVPNEIRGKAGPKRFRAIFVGYEEHRLGWRVRDLSGKYSFSNDIIFNENLPARLGVSRPLPPTSFLPVDSTITTLRPSRDRPRIRTAAGQAYDDVMELKQSRREERKRKMMQLTDDANEGANGGAHGGANEGASEVANGGAHGGASGVANSMEIDLSPSLEVIESLISFLDSSSFPHQIDTISLVEIEGDLIHSLLSDPFAFKAFSLPFSKPFDLSKAPLSYTEALARPDAQIWHLAMERERQSLMDMGAFEEVVLPKGERTIGLKWVFDIKMDANGERIHGKEKARLVAQGFNQRPGTFDETYAPVAKLASVRILLAWAAVQDLEIYQFDCKTVFLHAKIRHPLYARPFPGFPTSAPGMYLRILVALYGLRQSAYEFYILILSLLLEFGMVRCEVDHGIFFGQWSSSPHPSVSMPSDGTPLVLYIPLHVDDGLAITNSTPLYTWFLSVLAKRLHIVDLGPCAKFLNVLIIRDRPRRRLWLSPRIYISELLDEWNMASCRSAVTPFPSTLPDLSLAPRNSLPDISDADLLPQYQRLVGCLLYLAISTRPDIAYYAMWLGQFNSRPTRAHFLVAKHVLRYLAGTPTLALCLGVSSPRVPSSLSGYIQNMGCSDADWASNTADRRSVSGYSFYFQGSLVSWSAVKQKSIALSSTEAEYYAMAHAFKEALWLRTFLGLLWFPVPWPFPILSDNQAACALSNSLAISARSKHIDVRHHFIRDHVQAGSFSTTWIPTEDMPANIFTKPLPSSVFTRHRNVLGLSIPLIS